MIEPGLKIEQPSGRVITAMGGVIFPATLYTGHLSPMVLFLLH